MKEGAFLAAEGPRSAPERSERERAKELLAENRKFQKTVYVTRQNWIGNLMDIEDAIAEHEKSKKDESIKASTEEIIASFERDDKFAKLQQALSEMRATIFELDTIERGLKMDETELVAILG